MGHAAIKLTDKWQFTIPTRVRARLSIKPGDYLEPEVRKGVLILKPRKQILIDPNQEWFWTREWQDKELEVEKGVRKGRVRRSSGVKGLIKDLRK